MSTISKDWKKEIDFFEAPVEEIERIAREKLERLMQLEEHRKEVKPAGRQNASNASVDDASHDGGAGGGIGRDSSSSRQTTASYSRYSSSAKRDRSLSSHSSVSGSVSANTDFARGNGRLDNGQRDHRLQSSRELYHQSTFASAPSTLHKTSISKAGNASAAGIHPSRLPYVTQSSNAV